jgi:hypothetical protein
VETYPDSFIYLSPPKGGSFHYADPNQNKYKLAMYWAIQKEFIKNTKRITSMEKVHILCARSRIYLFDFEWVNKRDDMHMSLLI